MRQTWSLLGLGLLGLAGLVGFAFGSDAGKLILGTYLQRTAPQQTVASVTVPATTPFVVAFDGEFSSPEIFVTKGARDAVGLSPEFADGLWQRLDRHELAIRFGEEDPRIRVTSFSTRLWRKQKRIATLYFYPFEGQLDYRDSVSKCRRLFQSWGVADRIDWSEFERRLADRPIDEFVPGLEFSSAKLSLKLSCLDWNPEDPDRSRALSSRHQHRRKAARHADADARA